VPAQEPDSDEINVSSPEVKLRDSRHRLLIIVAGLVVAASVCAVVAFVLLQVDDTVSVESESASVMATEDAKYLQDVEHLGGFVLGDLAFPKIAAALKAGDADALNEFFHPEFAGKAFRNDGGTTTSYSFATFRNWDEDSDDLHSCGRQQFVKTLLEYRTEFSSLTSVGVKVMQMSPETYGDLHGPWIGTFKLILTGERQSGGIATRVVELRCRISGITDELPEQREWLLNCEMYQANYARTSNQLMRDMTSETGINIPSLHDNWKLDAGVTRPFLTGGLYACDYDKDGRVDILVTDKRGAALYHGDAGGKFSDVTEQVKLPRTKSLGAVFADFDGDGYEDLILARQLYRNDGGKRFVQLGLLEHNLILHPRSNNYSVVDFDRDGRMDVYIAGLQAEQYTAHRWIGRSDMSFNQLWRNLGNWQFENVTEKSGTKGGGSPTLGAAWFDANGDDHPDVMTACELGPNDYYLNNGDGTFRRGVVPEGYGGFSMGIAISDIDNNGFGDPYIANMYSKAGQRVVGNLRKGIYSDDVDAQMRDFVSGNELYRNRGDGSFDRIGQQAGIHDIGWTYGVGYVDLNGDGLDDLYSPAGFQSVSPHKPDG